jgi:hypothetical protein
MNTYAYVKENPTNAIDPLGLKDTTGTIIRIPIPGVPGLENNGASDGGQSSSSDAYENQGRGRHDRLVDRPGRSVRSDNTDALCPPSDSLPKKPKCYFEREVYYGGPEKACLYRQPGSIFTIRQYANKACPPIDPETCWVDTTGTPEERVKPPKYPY